MTRRIIELQTHNRTRRVPDFMAVECGGECRERFTPHLMQWSERVWLMDLRSCKRFWREEAARQGVDLLSLFQRMIPARAVTAAHPWRAVLGLEAMVAQGMDGLLDGSGAFGARLYRRLPWAVWFGTVEQLGTHFDHTGGKPYRRNDFRKDCELFQRAVKRLGFRTLGELGRVRTAAVQRRFGPCLALIWSWTQGGHRAGFPWIAWHEFEPPRVTRLLDYACREWTQVEAWLAEDLERLCRLESWSDRERVVVLSWRLVLEDLDEALVAPIRFRNPHNLHRERQAALLQARYAYERARALLLRERGELEEIDALAVVAWELEIEERFTCPERNLELFDWIGSGHRDRDKVKDMENQLPIPLQRYELRRDFLPEASFETYREYRPAREDMAPWLEAARHRPLFIHRVPKKVAEPPRRHQFLERVQVKWWQGAPGPNLNREYYRVWGAGRCRWMYRDQLGEWYEHGTYS